jgi:AbrB family looped-hinge helix DNA binding protein
MISAMKSTIDAAGRVVVPAAIRRQAGLEPGTRLEIRFRDGLVEIEPDPLPVALKRRGRWLVAVPDADVDALTADTVETTRRTLRRARASRA